MLQVIAYTLHRQSCMDAGSEFHICKILPTNIDNVLDLQQAAFDQGIVNDVRF